MSKIVGWGHWFTFYNVLLALLFATSYVWVSGWPTSLVDNLFLISYGVGHFSLLFFFGFVVLLFPLAFILPFWRTYRAIAIIVATLAQSLLLLDSLFYSQFGMHSNTLLFELLYSAHGDQIQLNWWKAIFCVSGLLVFEIILANWLGRWRSGRSRQVLGNRLSQSIFACIFVYNIAYAAADVMGHEGITRQHDFFPLSFPLTAQTVLARWGIHYSNDEPPGQLNIRFNYPLNPIEAQANQTPNVVLVVVSSLRADMLNPTNMPYTTQLARQSLWASRYYSSGQSHSDGMFGLMYGIPATYNNLAEYSQSQPYLTQWFQQQGYELALFSSQAPASTEQNNLYRGFNTLYIPTQRVNAALADTAALHQWQQYYTEHADTPTFSLINLTGVARYATPPGFSNQFQPDLEGVLLLDDPLELEGDTLLNRYKNAVLHADQLINYVVSQIDLSKTLLVITSDHGRYFSRNAQKVEQDYNPARIQVPFLMAGAGIEPRVTGGIAGHYDLSATLIQHLTEEMVDTTSFSSGLDLQTDGSRHEWLLVGNRKDFALIEADRLTRIRRFGDYTIYNNIMQPQPETKIRVAPMIQALRDMHRFSAHE